LNKNNIAAGDFKKAVCGIFISNFTKYVKTLVPVGSVLVAVWYNGSASRGYLPEKGHGRLLKHIF
jgi:hypothetical protein